MNAVHITPLLAALCFGSVGIAQAQQEPADPRPATSEAEGTAADRTPPNPSATNPSATRPVRPGEPIDQQADPRPSTNPGEGTAADSTPPGRTPTTARAASAQRSELVGTAVVTSGGAAIGKVVDVVFDSVAQPAFVVISSESGPAAVPYSVASSMKSGGKVVMDQARLKSAPKVKDDEWRNESGSHWQQDSTRYWEKGG